MSELPWLRLYSTIVDNVKIRLLAFEDRWHFVAILAFRRSGLLDNVDNPNFIRMLSIKMGLQISEVEAVKKRLLEVNLIDEKWQPVSWDEKQFESDSSTSRVRKHRAAKKKQGGNVSVTPPDTDTDTDTEKETRELKFAEAMFSKIAERYPKTKRPDLKKWADTIRLTVEQDSRDLEDLWKTFLWAHQDDFWSANVLSPKKLRSQFDQLTAHRQRTENKPISEDPPSGRRVSHDL